MCLLAHNSILFTTAWREQYVSACSRGIDPSCLCEHNGAGLEHGKGVGVADAAHNSPYPQSDRKVRVNSISRGLRMQWRREVHHVILDIIMCGIVVAVPDAIMVPSSF